MKPTILILFSLLTFSSFAQDYPFTKDFANGAIILKDSTLKTGQIKWDGTQTIKLRFRETEQGEVVKYSPEDIAGFVVGSQKFVSLLNFEAYESPYALYGKVSKIKRTFGRLIDTGKFNIYEVFIVGVDAISNSIQIYPNILFQNTQNNSMGLVAYPFDIRMKDKKYENAKEDLYILFKDYPGIVDAIKTHTKQNDFFEIVDMVRAIK
jgi:hypothetical protein